jgi:hypothetical protein
MPGTRCKAGSGNMACSADDRSDRGSRRNAAAAQRKRLPLRRAFEACSISQNAQTNAAPRLVTTPRNSSVRAGTESMGSMTPLTMQAAYRPGHANADAQITRYCDESRRSSRQISPPRCPTHQSGLHRHHQPWRYFAHICAAIRHLPRRPQQSMLARQISVATQRLGIAGAQTDRIRR